MGMDRLRRLGLAHLAKKPKELDEAIDRLAQEPAFLKDQERQKELAKQHKAYRQKHPLKKRLLRNLAKCRPHH